MQGDTSWLLHYSSNTLTDAQETSSTSSAISSSLLHRFSTPPSGARFNSCTARSRSLRVPPFTAKGIPTSEGGAAGAGEGEGVGTVLPVVEGGGASPITGRSIMVAAE